MTAEFDTAVFFYIVVSGIVIVILENYITAHRHKIENLEKKVKNLEEQIGSLNDINIDKLVKKDDLKWSLYKQGYDDYYYKQ